MGTARIEVVRLNGPKSGRPAGLFAGQPTKTYKESTSTSATTSGSRIQISQSDLGGYSSGYLRITHDEICWVVIGANPTAAELDAGAWQTQAGVPLIVPVNAGDKLSFKEAA